MLLSLFQFHLASNHLTSDFNPSSRPPTHTLTSWSRFFYFNHPASFELFLGVPSSCDRNATHLRCIWPPPGPRQCDVAFIISSGYLPFLCHLPAPSGTFFCHMASIHPASLCSPFCEFPLYITLWQFFSLLLNFWSLLSSQVSLPCPVLSHHMAAYRVMIATYVYNSFIVLRTSITLPTGRWFCSYVSNFRGWEGASLQNEPTLLHKLILSVGREGIGKPNRKLCDMNSQEFWANICVEFLEIKLHIHKIKQRKHTCHFLCSRFI